MSPPLTDVLFDISAEGIARISINRPEYHNAFRPRTVLELSRCLEHAQDNTNIGVIILCGEGGHAFCSGGDQAVRGEGGYDDGSESVPRLRVLDLQIQMRRCPKPIIAMVAGYAVGGGHILHMVADITIAAENGEAGLRLKNTLLPCCANSPIHSHHPLLDMFRRVRSDRATRGEF